MLTCLHCSEPVDHLQGVWFHPHRRFRGDHGGLPTLCDFGGRVGPTHATPITFTPSDRDFLCSIHVAADEENFLLEALWLDWRHANLHRDLSPCAGCGAKMYGQHTLDCKRGAPMTFDDSVLHRKCANSASQPLFEKLLKLVCKRRERVGETEASCNPIRTPFVPNLFAKPVQKPCAGRSGAIEE